MLLRVFSQLFLLLYLLIGMLKSGSLFTLSFCRRLATRIINKGKMAASQQELMAYLENNAITETELIEHPEVFTVETMMPYLKDVDGLVCKNLFLKDKKKRLILLTCLHSQEINLGGIGKKIGFANPRFADESVMIEKLGVAQGCCTPLSIFKDVNKEVNLVVDSRFVEEGVKVFAHPMVNTATLGLKSEDLIKFFKATEHEPIIIDFSDA